MIVGNLVATLRLDAKGFVAGITAATNSIRNVNKSIVSSVAVLRDYTAGLALAGGAAFYATKKLADMVVEMQAINRKMEFVTGGGEKLVHALKFIRATASSLSLSLEDLTASYANLSAAVRSTGLTTSEVESIFLAMSEASSVFGLSSMRTRMVFLAIEQMASKGVISMEELRRQLGDHLPGAINTMADALGVGTAELNKLVSTGQLVSEEILPLFAQQLRVDLYDAVQKLGTGVRSSLAGLKTAWFDLKQEMSGGVVEGSLKVLIDFLSGSIILSNVAVKSLNMFGGAISDIVKGVKDFSIAGNLLTTTNEEVVDSTEEVIDELSALKTTLEELRVAFWANFGANTEAELKAWRDTVNETFEDVASEFTALIVGMASGADVSFKSMLDNMLKHILTFTTHMLVVQPILEWFKTWLQDITAAGGAGGSGIFGALISALGANVKAVAKPTTAMADGGIINEPVVGVGLKSNSSYLLGESGPEAVVPTGAMGGGGSNVSVNINAVDSKSVTDLLRRNPQAIIGPLVKAMNGGDRGLATSMRMAVG